MKGWGIVKIWEIKTDKWADFVSRTTIFPDIMGSGETNSVIFDVRFIDLVVYVAIMERRDLVIDNI